MIDGETTASAINRRGFLQASTASAVALGAATHLNAADDKAPTAPISASIPKRMLGKTGVEVSILNLGTWKSPGLDRLLRFAYANGVRYYDTAKSYGSEPGIGNWFQAQPEVRKEVFLVTKDHPRSVKDLVASLDQRLEALKTDYIDLLFLHGIGGGNSVDLPKSKEFKETVEALKKTGKCKFVGFSCHDPKRAEYLMSAAEGGFIDVVMVQYTPWLDKDHPMQKALDACHKAGIGLISMKQVAGQGAGLNEADPTKQVFDKVPLLKERGLTPYQALLHAIWSDERISSCCVSMRNTAQITENSIAAKTYQPLKTAEIQQLRDAFLAKGPTFCADCDGRCSIAAGTEAALFDLTRFLTYHEHHGYRGEAKKLYGELTESARNFEGADLAAAQQACPNHLDFAKLLPKVQELLA